MCEMYNHAHLKVKSITNYQLLKSETGVNVTAVVTTSHPKSGYIETWTCTVYFEKFQESFVAKGIDCR